MHVIQCRVKVGGRSTGSKEPRGSVCWTEGESGVFAFVSLGSAVPDAFLVAGPGSVAIHALEPVLLALGFEVAGSVSLSVGQLRVAFQGRVGTHRKAAAPLSFQVLARSDCRTVQVS